MVLVDTHAHLYSNAFAADRHEMVQRALDAGVQQMLLPNIDVASIAGMLALEEAYPEHCFAMMGLHPCSVKANYEEELAVMRAWLDRRSFVAIGEIGIDLYWDKTFVEEQKRAFLEQASWAMAFDLPIVIHARESTDMLIELVSGVNDKRLRGVFHCFTGNQAQAEAIVELGFKLGIGGVLTYKTSDLSQVLPQIPLEHILLETDSPYLPPVPYRGKRNESAYTKLVAERLSEVYGLSVEEIGRQTTHNARELFRLSEVGVINS